MTQPEIIPVTVQFPDGPREVAFTEAYPGGPLVQIFYDATPKGLTVVVMDKDTRDLLREGTVDVNGQVLSLAINNPATYPEMESGQVHVAVRVPSYLDFDSDVNVVAPYTQYVADIEKSVPVLYSFDPGQINKETQSPGNINGEYLDVAGTNIAFFDGTNTFYGTDYQAQATYQATATFPAMPVGTYTAQLVDADNNVLSEIAEPTLLVAAWGENFNVESLVTSTFSKSSGNTVAKETIANGTGFYPRMQAELVGPGSGAVQIQYLQPDRVNLIFFISNRPVGTYDIRFTDMDTGAELQVLPAAITLNP